MFTYSVQVNFKHTYAPNPGNAAVTSTLQQVFDGTLSCILYQLSSSLEMICLEENDHRQDCKTEIE